MGWSSGTAVLREAWASVRQKIPTSDREESLCELMRVFARHDCDTVGEVVCDDWYESAGAYQRFCEIRAAGASRLMQERGHRDGLAGLNPSSTNEDYMTGYGEGRRERVIRELNGG
jgi:hypothetical protein